MAGDPKNNKTNKPGSGSNPASTGGKPSAEVIQPAKVDPKIIPAPVPEAGGKVPVVPPTSD